MERLLPVGVVGVVGVVGGVGDPLSSCASSCRRYSSTLSPDWRAAEARARRSAFRVLMGILLPPAGGEEDDRSGC